MPPRLTLLSVSFLLLATSASHAENGDIVWNGFLNVVGGMLKDEAIEDFSNVPQKPNYMAYQDQLVFDAQTSAGLQAQKRLDDKTSITMQLYGEGDSNHYEATLKWLYLTYEPTYHSSFRIGKISAPVYYYSDYLNVGYAYHWVSPPESVYPFDTGMNGVNYVYQNTWENIDWSAELMVGSGDDDFPIIGARVITRNSRGFAFNASTMDWLSFRAMILLTDATFEVDALSEDSLRTIVELATDAALEAAGLSETVAAALREDWITATRAQLDNGALDLENFDVTYGDLAIRAETERWLLMAEAISVRTDSYLYNNLVSSFITGGVHYKNALYHLTLAKGKANPHNDVSADRHNTVPTGADSDAVGNVIASQIRTLLAGAFDRSQESVSLGVRYETSANTAVKFEITHFKELPSFDGDTFGVGENLLFRAALNATF